MASNWLDLKDSIAEWQANRINMAVVKLRKDAVEFKEDVIDGVYERPKTRVPRIPTVERPEEKEKNPLNALDQYAGVVIIDEEGSGIDTVQTVKIEDPSKKDETTGMTIGKIAKAIEFGTSRNAPRPAWRRALAKMRATGIYKER